MKKAHRSNRHATTRLTAFWSLFLGFLLLLVLTACGDRQSDPPAQTALNSPSASLEAASTPTSRSTRPVSRYATRTPTSGPPQPTPTPVETLDVVPEELSGKVVTFWHPWSGELADVMQAIINEFNRTNRWGISVVTTHFDSFPSLEQAFSDALLAGSPPSLLVAYDDRAQQWDQGGQKLVNLQAYIGDPVWGLTTADLQDFFPAFWQQGVAYDQVSLGNIATRQLSLPLHRSELVLFYNQSWAAELGYKDFPVTPFELRRQVCEASRANREAGFAGSGGLMLSVLPATTPGRNILLHPEQLLGWMAAYGALVNLPEGAGYQFNTPETQRALEFLKDLNHDGCVYLTDGVSPADEFAARSGLLYVASTAELPAIKAAFNQLQSQDKWTILPFPTANGAASVVAYGPSLIIPQTDRLQQLSAWTLLQWLVSPPNQARWVQAIGAYPTRLTTYDFLGSAITSDPAWTAGLELLPNALAEPPLASWGLVRWMMGDALAELFTADFSPDQIPTLLEDLDRLAAEVFTQVR